MYLLIRRALIVLKFYWIPTYSGTKQLLDKITPTGDLANLESLKQINEIKNINVEVGSNSNKHIFEFIDNQGKSAIVAGFTRNPKPSANVKKDAKGLGFDYILIKIDNHLLKVRTTLFYTKFFIDKKLIAKTYRGPFAWILTNTTIIKDTGNKDFIRVVFDEKSIGYSGKIKMNRSIYELTPPERTELLDKSVPSISGHIYSLQTNSPLIRFRLPWKSDTKKDLSFEFKCVNNISIEEKSIGLLMFSGMMAGVLTHLKFE
jgi:hypothetical protein